MKKVVFIMTTAFLALCVNACKTPKTESTVPKTTNSIGKTDLALADKYWKLIELFGNPIANNNAKEPHIVFKTEGYQFSGDAGCNRILGSYELKEPNRITFSPVAGTLMMCINMDTEDKFLEVLKKADSYIIKNDTLILNRARMAPLARFVAVDKK